MSLYEQKRQYYRDYCTELNLYRKADFMTEDQADNASYYYINTDQSKWINVFFEKELVGFLIIGKHGDEKDPDADYSIAQAYITPECRHQGLMRKEAGEYIHNHDGTWSALILKDNDYAFNFWSRMFQKEGYVLARMDNEGEYYSMLWKKA